MSPDPKQTVKFLIRQHDVVSDLGLHCLPLSYKKEARLICVKYLASVRPHSDHLLCVLICKNN